MNASCLQVEALQAPVKTLIQVPSDKSISHRAAILAGLADGTTLVSNFLKSEDCLNTLNAMSVLGAEVEEVAPACYRITGTNARLVASDSPIDCGNSGTGMRLLAGMLCAHNFNSELYGDTSLSSRPMMRIIEPLGAMGAKIEALGSKPGCAPLLIHGGKLQAVEWTMKVASAQVKSAILLAALNTKGVTTVHQPSPTRDHTERLFAHFDVECSVNGNSISLEGPQVPQARDLTVPGDISSAAFWMVAAAMQPGSYLELPRVGINPTRSAVVDVLRRMGANIEYKNIEAQAGESYATIVVQGGTLKAVDLLEHEIANLIDEIPVLAVAATQAEGTSNFRNAAELRVKETDRIATVAANLKAMGGSLVEYADGFSITGKQQLKGCQLDSFGDHRIAMAFLIAGLYADGRTIMSNCGCINTSYPDFAAHLAAYVASQQLA